MAFYEYNGGYKANASSYNYISFNLYSNIDYRNAGRNSDYFQINFYTTGEDGYNLAIPASQIAAGWHTYVIRKSDISRVVSADWRSISGVRFTWFNVSHGSNVIFAVDSVKAIKGGVTAYPVDSSTIMLSDCNDTTGWTPAWGTELEQSIAVNPVGYYINMINTGYANEANVTHGVGGMLFYNFTSAANLRNYNTLKFELYSPIDYKSAGRNDDYVEVIFASENGGQSGFRYVIPASSINQGWQWVEIPFSNFTNQGVGASWDNIRCMRLTWFNYSEGSQVDLAFDTITATYTQRVVSIDDASNTDRWSTNQICYQSGSNSINFWWDLVTCCKLGNPIDISSMKKLRIDFTNSVGADNSFESLFSRNTSSNYGIALTSYTGALPTGNGGADGATNGGANFNLSEQAWTTYGVRVSAADLANLTAGVNDFTIDWSTQGSGFNPARVTGIAIVGAPGTQDSYINGVWGIY